MTLSEDTGTIALIATIVWVAVAVGFYVWWGWALGRLFTILGAPRWRAWVPVVNSAEVLRLGGQPSWYVVLAFIPIANIYGVIVYIQALHAITVQMGRGAGMTVLGVFVPPLWATLLSSESGKAQSRYAVHPEAIAASVDPARAHSGLTPPTPVAGLAHAFQDPEPSPLEPSVQEPSIARHHEAPMGAPYAVRPVAASSVTTADSDPNDVWSEPRRPAIREQEQAQSGALLEVAGDSVSLPAETRLPLVEPNASLEFPSVTEHTPVPPLPLSPIGLPAYEDSTPQPSTPAFLNAPAPDLAPEPHPVAPLWEPQPSASAWPQPIFAPQAPQVDPAPVTPSTAIEAEPTFAIVDIAGFEDEDEDGVTIMVDRRPVVTWQLTLDSGAAFPITHSTVIVGRKPTSLEGTVQALALPDLTKTLSKVHARLELINNEWFITDLHSTNGVILTSPSGEEVAVAEGERAKVSGRFVLGKVGMALVVAS